ncbi:ABC transporter ATP-binding protein [Dactylosporangium vinaceum]|uniref:ABC transporter ATP-binding protein n=1 Tax=Dactylosporangium vinaceum TaxID=53362 RepID=A0ABV5MFE4_9ACTN|nr:ABC transporter ATP-binding protein [Dactylosporangium vinaceum]UAB98684.1 ABC transporter ATP-binding protein [Dactylosporangium vinaceum]
MANTHAVLRAAALDKRYGRRAALREVELDVPAQRIIGLVGPNGAGKSTLLQLACGLIEPSAGTLTVLGRRPAADAAHLARVGFVAQDAPVYAGLSVAEHLRMGAKLNPGWDDGLARDRVAQAGLPLTQRAGRLSGGQRAQLALTLAAAKRPELLILDEPAAALDPLARDTFLRSLLESVAAIGASAILSSHLLADVERVCDYLIVLAGGRVQLAGDVTDLLATHFRRPGAASDVGREPRDGSPPAGAGWMGGRSGRDGVEHVHGCVVRAEAAPAGAVPVELEELVLAYLGRAAAVEVAA